MLSSFDDFPVHQTSAPVAHTATSDPNHYDRYFFNGYPTDGAVYFAVAMGLYPNRHVADAAFSVAVDGRQHSVFRSQRAPADRAAATDLGPLRIEVLEPLHRLRVAVDAPEHGLRCDLTFTARARPIEEPHFSLRVGVRTIFDYTRLTQFGHWEGWMEVDGTRIDVAADRWWGSRDRSWGIRPVGESASVGAPVGAPQFFWLWAPVNFTSCTTHFDVNEVADGSRWHQAGAIGTDGSEAAMMRDVDWRVTWRPGTRWADRFEYDLVDTSGAVTTVRLRPRYEFMMRGLGYGHPEFGHGCWKGEASTAGETILLPVGEPLARDHLHVQAVCAATMIGPDGQVSEGCGILEQLALGPHRSGLVGLFDGAA